MASILIKNGDLVSPLGVSTGDILVEEGRIAKLGVALKDSASQVIDATGHYVFPGGLDPHVHLDMPFMGEVSADNFETGTAAAVAGGTTTVIDFVIPGRNQSLLDALKGWHAKSKNAVADYSYHMSVTWYDDSVGNEIKTCVEKEGISSFKIFLAYKGAIGVTETELFHTMTAVKKNRGLVNCHCENGEIIENLQAELAAAGKLEPKYHEPSRPSYVEGYGTHTAITFSEMTGCPVYIVHVSCREAAAEIIRARNKGLEVYGETCPQYLLLDASVYDQPNFEGAKYVMSPPIRPKGHAPFLWGALKGGSLQVVGTDHCPFNFKKQKELGRNDFRKIPNGGPGIEDRLKVLYTYGVMEHKLSMPQFVDLVSTKPAQIYGLYPQKGSLRVGADADLVVWNKNTPGTIRAKDQHQKVDYNLFEGFKTLGGPSYVLVGGTVAYEQGKLKVTAGKGRFLKRAPYVSL